MRYFQERIEKVLMFICFFYFSFLRLSFTLESDSAAHKVIDVIHGIFLFDFGFKVHNFLVLYNFFNWSEKMLIPAWS
jgi:hypothetical protein